MHGLTIEKHPLNSKPLSRNLAELLFNYIYYGKIVVVADKPVVLHSTIRRRWKYMTRRLQVDRSRTLNRSEIDNINNQLYVARCAHFSSKPPDDDLLTADITFMTLSDCMHIAPSCQTLCVTCEVPREKLHLMTAWMSKGGKVILYE